MSIESKRILVVTLRYPPYVAGGYELLTRDAVLALRERGHHVDVLSGKGERLHEGTGVLPWLEPDLDAGDDLFRRSIEGSNSERFQLHFLRMSNYRATLRAIDVARPDVVFFFNLGLVSIAPILAARHAGVATLGYVSDPWPANHWLLEWEKRGTKPDRLAFMHAFWAGFRDLVSLGPLLTCSSYLARRLQATGIAASTTRAVHLGVPPDMEVLAKECEMLSRTPDEPLRVVCLSSFWDGKGQDVLLRATAIARASGVDVEVVLAGTGTGEFLDELHALADGPALAGSVTFTGALDRTGVSRLLASSHVLVLPSTWGEPFALSTLEGLAHGLAVVVSDAGGSPEALIDGEQGLIVPAGDDERLAEALGTLAGDEDLRTRLGAAGRERARGELSHASFIDQVEEALARTGA